MYRRSTTLTASVPKSDRWTRAGRGACARLAAAIVLLHSAATALAQPARQSLREEPPFDVQALDPGHTWVPWLFVFGFITLFAVTCFKNPHRVAGREK